MIFLDVAVCAPLHHTLTYLPPKDEGPVLVPGLRLLVPLGRRLVTGYLLALTETEPDYELKHAAVVLDETPLFPAGLIPFFSWIARYYQHPIGEVIQTALPAGLAPRSGRRITITEEGKNGLLGLFSADDAKIPSWLGRLLEEGALSPAGVRRIRPGREQRLLVEWSARGWIMISEGLCGETTRAKTEPWLSLVRPTPRKDDIGLTPAEEKTLAVLIDLINQGGHDSIPRKEIIKIHKTAGPSIRALAQKGFVQVVLREVYRDPFGERLPSYNRPEQLSIEQEAVLGSIIGSIKQKEFTPFLLHGVTDSGKTEVYLRATEATLALGRSVLVLVPEIALASQLEGHFISRFGDRVALLHSGLSTGERFDQWLRLVREEAAIVIGARSAIFAPLVDPGLIVVDEEHDGAYKQEDGLRYQARDLAVLRGQLQQATVILGSATPALQSYHHATTGKYRLLNLTSRVQERLQPEVQVIDLKGIQTISGRPPLFSPALIIAIKENLAQGNQTLLFLNRRGYANMTVCQDCGHILSCRNCEITLTLHRKRQELLCHYCGFSAKSAQLCPNCQGVRMLGVGLGTEKIEAELAGLVPKARIARMDRDTTGSRHDFLRILKAVHNREVDILVGTQMITKGHHFPGVTLVGVIWADAGLGFPDYKSAERTFQLLSQVTGRAGRGELPGRVIIQTHQPGHPSVEAAMAHDYLAFFHTEIGRRRPLGYPPFSRLILLRLEGKDEEEVRQAATLLSSAAKKIADRISNLAILGPAPAPLARLREKFRWHILIKSPDVKALHRVCAETIAVRIPAITSGRVKLVADVDPENML